MVTEILNIIHNWNPWFQFFLVCGLATMGTAIVLALIGAIGDFFTVGLPIIFRGYGPDAEEPDEDDHL